MIRGAKVKVKLGVKPIHMVGMVGIVTERFRNGAIGVLFDFKEGKDGWCSVVGFDDEDLEIIEIAVDL